MTKLRDRVAAVAEELLLRNGSVSAADVARHVGGGSGQVETWAKRRRLVAVGDAWTRATPPSADLVAIAPVTEWACVACEDTGDLMIPDGPLCVDCADVGHLVFLPSGNAALSRRARVASPLCLIVLGYVADRKRFTRIGILVVPSAVERAEELCLADEEVRARRREREKVRRDRDDEAFRYAFADRILELFPGLPAARATEIASHAGARGTGRIGRSAAGRALDSSAVLLAVVAAVRHQDTDYDTLLMSGMPRAEARATVQPVIDAVLAGWLP